MCRNRNQCSTVSCGVLNSLPLCTHKQLGRHVRGGHVERLNLGLRHALSVGLGVQRNFRGKNRMFLGRDFLHVGLFLDNTVLNVTHQIVPGCSSRGAAPVAIAAGEFSHGGRPPGSSLSGGEEIQVTISALIIEL